MLLTIFCESSWNGNTSKVISWQCRVLMTFTLRIFNPVVLLDYMSGSAKWWNCHRNFAPILLHFARRSDQAAFGSLFFTILNVMNEKITNNHLRAKTMKTTLVGIICAMQSLKRRSGNDWSYERKHRNIQSCFEIFYQIAFEGKV